jgi:hypothetical protein
MQKKMKNKKKRKLKIFKCQLLIHDFKLIIKTSISSTKIIFNDGYSPYHVLKVKFNVFKK